MFNLLLADIEKKKFGVVTNTEQIHKNLKFQMVFQCLDKQTLTLLVVSTSNGLVPLVAQKWHT